MTVATNDITGDRIVSRGLSEEGKANYDLIFRKPKAEKPVVHYRRSKHYTTPIQVGWGAWIITLDHPNHLEGHSVTNGELVRTSMVIAYDEATGEFETANTKYVPVKCLECGAATQVEAETKCICSGDKDHCHGVDLWPE